MQRDLGDYQTPRELAAAIVRRLGPVGNRWTRVLEPTCGTGTFLRALLEGSHPPREMIGVELQERHHAAASSLGSGRNGTRVELIRASLFDLDLRNDLPWHDSGRLLVVGNPPWVTSAALGKLGSGNVPEKSNIKNLKGLDALTGSSNFDIGEAVWLKLLAELADQRPTIALLCKTAVARAVLERALRLGLPVSDAAVVEIDARRWFGAAVGACLLHVTVGHKAGRTAIPVYSGMDESAPLRSMGWHQGRLVSDTDAVKRHAFALGTCPLTWRQGVKHDASAVMELEWTGSAGVASWRNKLGEAVDVEAEYLFPLVKGTDLRKPASARPRRALIVTQERIGQETTSLEHRSPRLLEYLSRHDDAFMNRKSSIYRGQPRYALFGIGPYSFAPYKVAVSGLHRPALFQAIGPVEDRPVMLDDTCYLLPCQSAVEAAVLQALCNDPIALELIGALSFADAKRPVTKGLLQRLDLSAILMQLERGDLAERAGSVLSDHLGKGHGEIVLIPAAIERLNARFQSEPRPRLQQGQPHGICTDQLLEPVASEGFVGQRRVPG